MLCFYSAEKAPVQEILLELSDKISTKWQCKFNINCTVVWEGALRGLKRVSYDPNMMMCVKLSDDVGTHEEGVDLGGPTRETLPDHPCLKESQTPRVRLLTVLVMSGLSKIL